MMKARYMVERPDEIEMTAKITMTAKEWDELRDQLANKWPASRLSSIITEMLADARRVFYATTPDPES